jgi:hypothetical protein
MIDISRAIGEQTAQTYYKEKWTIDDYYTQQNQLQGLLVRSSSGLPRITRRGARSGLRPYHGRQTIGRSNMSHTS